ncbi:MAG: tetratricopeptide repeat protein [Phycisphaerales bacterium]
MTGQATTQDRGGRAWIVAAVGLVLLLLAATIQKVWAGDTWWQINTGEWIAAHRAVPTTDVFSFTSGGKAIVEVRWLYCLLLHWGWQLGGAAPLIAAVVVVIGATWGLLAWAYRRVVMTPIGTVVIGLCLVAGLGRWVLRPEMMTYLLTAAFLVVLDADSRRPLRRTLWLIPALQVVWVNTHTVFILGPILVFTFALGALVTPIVRRVLSGEGAAPEMARQPEAAGYIAIPMERQGRRAGRLALVGLATLAACLVSPYLHRSLLVAWEVWVQSRADSIVAQSIIELRSPFTLAMSQWRLDFWAMALLMLAGFASFLPLVRRPDAARFAVCSAGVYLAASGQRHIALMSIMVGWAILANLRDWNERRAMTGAPGGDVQRASWLAALPHLAVGLAAAAIAWYVVTDRLAINTNAPRESGIGVVDWGTPRGAAEFILREKPAGNLFNTMRDGGYLAWQTKQPIYIDGRTDAYSEDFLREFFNHSANDWERLADRWSLGVAIVTNTGFSSLVSGIRASPRWALVHLDQRNLVFVRRSPENAALIARCEIDPAKPWSPREPEPVERPARWKVMLGGPARPWFSAGMADSFWAIGDFEDAARYFERTLVIRPGDATALLSLPSAHRNAASTLIERGAHAAAIPHLRRALELSPADQQPRKALAFCMASTGDPKGAAAEYEAFLAATPNAPIAEWNNYALSLELSGDLPKAARAYAASLERDQNQANVWNQLGTVLARSGDMSRARECFERALRLKPDYRSARENLDKLPKE